MLKAKVADTPHKLEQGLMFVKDMPQDEGMLFVFPRPQVLNFWGKNTFIPLDIAFVDRDDTVIKIARIEPFDLSGVNSEQPCPMAIEANAGYFEDNGIGIGDKVIIDRGSFRDDAHISFKRTKDSLSDQGKIKESQVAGTDVPIVDKPGVDVVGDPISIEPEEAPDPNLPVINPSDIGQYLEDGFDEDEQMPQDGLDGNIDEQPQDVTQDEQPPAQEKEYPVFSSVFDATEWAEKNAEVIRISYTTKHGRQIIRDVEPHGSFHADSTKREILVTYDETVDGIRAFIMSNIGNWAFVGRKFQKKFVVKA